MWQCSVCEVFSTWNFQYVKCSVCEVFSMWSVQCVQCEVCEVFSMWSFQCVWSVQYGECSVCDVFSMWSVQYAKCSVCGVFSMWSVQCVKCSVCGVFSMWSVQYVECSVCEVFSMWSVQYVKCFESANVIMRLTMYIFCVICMTVSSSVERNDILWSVFCLLIQPFFLGLDGIFLLWLEILSDLTCLFSRVHTVGCLAVLDSWPMPTDKCGFMLYGSNCSWPSCNYCRALHDLHVIVYSNRHTFYVFV
jgi:hypothetical protein